MPAFQIAANDPFRLLPAPTPPLSLYTTFFYFALGFSLVSGSLNVWLMYRCVMLLLFWACCMGLVGWGGAARGGGGGGLWGVQYHIQVQHRRSSHWTHS